MIAHTDKLSPLFLCELHIQLNDIVHCLGGLEPFLIKNLFVVHEHIPIGHERARVISTADLYEFKGAWSQLGLETIIVHPRGKIDNGTGLRPTPDISRVPIEEDIRRG